MIDAPRSIIFIHGVQWEPNSEIRGYSVPLQNAIARQAPSTRFRFKEVLWSDIVEQKEREILNAGKLIDILGTGNISGLGDVVQMLLEHIFKLQGMPASSNNKDTNLKTKVSDLIKNSGQGFAEKAYSAIMDVIIYESGIGGYQEQIQGKLAEALDGVKGELAPIVYAHSLGSVIAYDVLAKRSKSNSIPALGFITAGSPLGVLKRDPSRTPELKDKLINAMFWKNYYDADDFLAFWNPLKAFGYRNLADEYAIDVSPVPFYSHTRYWSSDEIARDLADLATTAKTPAE